MTNSFNLEGDAAFGAVVLNPDFAVFDVDVEDADVDEAFIEPADVDDLAAIGSHIEDGLGFCVFVAGFGFAVSFQQVLNQLAVLFYAIS